MLHRLSTRLHLPVALLVIVLQRAPQIYHGLLSRVSLPSIQAVQKAFFASASLGAAHAVSGATVTRYSVNNSNYTIGAQLIIHRETGEEGDPVQIGISNTLTPEFWTVEGDLPPGLRMTDFQQQANLVEGNFNASAPFLLGNYTQAGDYVLTLKPWSVLNGEQTTAPQALTITFQIAEGTPQPTVPPKLHFEKSQDTLVLTWDTGSDTGYRLTRSTDLATWTPIELPTENADGQTRASAALQPNQDDYFRFEPLP